MCTPDPFLFNNKKQLVFHGRIDNAMKPDDTATEKTMINNIGKIIVRCKKLKRNLILQLDVQSSGKKIRLK